MGLTLVIANKAYSSWSFRPWILMRHVGIAFDEVTIPLAQQDTRAEILRYSPSAKCPVLKDGEIAVWDSLAIIEYLAEVFPRAAIWPRDRAARAKARSLAAEMHSGFVNLRAMLPMNMRRKVKKRELNPEAAADVARIEEIFRTACQAPEGSGFLFGDFSAADAMFAPVVNRLHVYDVAVSAGARAYMDRIMGLAVWKEWAQGAQAEPWIIDKYEIG